MYQSHTIEIDKSAAKRPAIIYLWIELLGLLVLCPVLLALPVPMIIKVSSVLLALLYCSFVSHGLGLFQIKSLLAGDHTKLSRNSLTRFLLFVVLSIIVTWVYLPQQLFIVALSNPLLWLAISVFYGVFSVYPQEFVYRLFFFKRYGHLLSNEYGLILLNASLFSFAHLFFQNTLVFVLTFVGGIMFALTYKKTQSLMLVTIEHSAYGVWLFTLGLGNMLAFPGG